MEFSNLLNKFSELRSPALMNNFYLPFTNHKNLDLIFFIQDQIYQYSDFLIFPNTNIAGVYGNFSNNIWNGGRTFSSLDFSNFNLKKECLSNINSHSMICKFTFTNQLLTKEHCLNKECNQLLDLIAETNNEIVIYSIILEDYIRERYPLIGLTSSITKGNSLEVFKNNIHNNYKAVVCFYKRNILQYIEQLNNSDKNKIELLLNDDGCAYCNNSINHFKSESFNNLYGTTNVFPCQQYNQNYKNILALPVEETLFYNIQYFQDIGIHNYKIRGRGESINKLISIYINTFFQPEIHKTIYNDIIRYFS